MNDNAIFVKISHNYNPIYVGLDELVDELKKDYQVQSKPLWIPSFSEQNEFWLEIFINSELFKFLSNIVIGGITWDLIKIGVKKFNLRRLITLIDSFINQNQGNIIIQNVKFEFDDITIKVLDIENNFMSTLSAIFNAIYKEIPYLEKLGYNDICNINIPLSRRENGNDFIYHYGLFFEEQKKIEHFLFLWEIITGYGCQRFIYNLSNKEIFENFDGVS